MPLTFDAAGDAELSATLHNRRPQIIDNILDGTAYLNALRTYGGIEVDTTGGVGIVRGLRFEKNNSTGSFSGTDTFTVAEQNSETSANWPWSNLWVHITIPWDEETRNSGMAQLINLVNMKIDGAEESLRDTLNLQLMQTQPPNTAPGLKDMITLTEIIDAIPTGNPPRGTVPLGGIDQSDSANAWVRNLADVSGGAFSMADLRTIYNQASDGHDKVTFILCSRGAYEDYENDQVDQIRYGSGPTIDAGADELLFKKTPMMWDPNVFVPADSQVFYGINTKYHKLLFHAKGQFATSDFIEADNGAYKVAKILIMANQFCTNRRRQFVYTTT